MCCIYIYIYIYIYMCVCVLLLKKYIYYNNYYLLHFLFGKYFQLIKMFNWILYTVSWAANMHIIMISERSCDTGGWSNGFENSALHHRNKLHFTVYYNTIFHNTEIIFHNIAVFTLFFDQINAALVSSRYFFKTLETSNLCTVLYFVELYLYFSEFIIDSQLNHVLWFIQLIKLHQLCMCVHTRVQVFQRADMKKSPESSRSRFPCVWSICSSLCGLWGLSCEASAVVCCQKWDVADRV